MRKEIMILGSIGIALFLFFIIPKVNSFTTTYFNNSLTIENLTFTGNSNLTRYLGFYRYANVTSSTLNLSGYVGEIRIHQESATHNTSFCSGACSGSGNEKDGNFNTNFQTQSSLIITENYTFDSNWHLNDLNYTWKGGGSSGGTTYIWNYSSNLWATVLTGSSNYESGYNTIYFNLSSFGINSSNSFLVNITLAGGGSNAWFWEGALNYGNDSYIQNPYLEIGTPNGVHEWNYTGQFNQTNNKTLDLSASINTALGNGNCTGGTVVGNNCSIPFLFHSDTAGILQYSNIDINWDSRPNVTLDSPTNNSFSSASQTFQCSAIDGVGLSDMKLYIWNSTNSLNITDQTTSELNFDGVNDRVSISPSPTINWTTNGNFSWSMWFKVKDNTTAVRYGLFQTHGDVEKGIILGLNTTNRIIYVSTQNTSGAVEYIYSNNTPQINSWYYLAVNYYNKTVDIYLNTTLVGNNSFKGSANNGFITSESLIGDESAVDANSCNCSIDEVRFYNRTLSTSEITQIYNSGRFPNSSITKDGLGGWYTSSDSSKINVSDFSGNNNKGVTSTATWSGFLGLSNTTSFNATFTKADTYLWNCLAMNIELNSSFSNTNYTHTVDLTNPVITLNYPTNNTYLNNRLNVPFNYTPSHSDGLDTCRLYADFNGSFSINLTDTSITNYSVNTFTQNISEKNGHIWTVWCNSTNGNSAFSQSGNLTLNIDITYPNTTIGTITTTSGSQTITFNNTVQDLNLNTCKYSIFDSAGAIDGLNNNISFTCNSNTQATVTAFGTFNLTIYAIDLANNENSSTKSLTTVASSGGGGGGGGSTTTTQIPVIALQDINSSEVYSDLTKAILYSTINNYCSNKINKEPLAIVDYSQQCQLTTNDLQPIINNLKEFAVDISEEDLRKFIENYKQSKFLQTYATEENIKEYGLFTSVLGETTIWLLTPPSIDSYFTIFNREGTVETLPRVISSNKPLKSCEVVSNTPSLICEVTSNYTAKLSYEITDTSFFTKTFSGTILLTTDAEPERTEQRRSQVTFRVINFGSNTAIYSGIGTLGIVSLLISIYIKRKRVKFSKQVRELISLK